MAEGIGIIIAAVLVAINVALWAALCITVMDRQRNEIWRAAHRGHDILGRRASYDAISPMAHFTALLFGRDPYALYPDWARP